MATVTFSCEKCGECCRSLRKWGAGLFLTKRETALFPSSAVSPQFALGRRGPKYEISYQLIPSTCPHLDAGNQCEIYDKRPLACQAFPFEKTLIGWQTSTFCSAIRSQMKANALRPTQIPQKEGQAADKLQGYQTNMFKTYMKPRRKLWLFDLVQRKWVERGSSVTS